MDQTAAFLAQAHGPTELSDARSFIDAAVDAGGQCIVYSSVDRGGKELPVLWIASNLILATTLVMASPDSKANAPEAYWPSWRGPLATGVGPLADPPITWSEQKNIRWRTPLPGKGHSSPIVWGDRIFLTTAIPFGEPVRPRLPARPGAHDNLSLTQNHEFAVLADHGHLRGQPVGRCFAPEPIVDDEAARVAAVGEVSQRGQPEQAAPVAKACAPGTTRQVFFGGWREVPVYSLDDLEPGHAFAGPAIVEAETTTVVVGSQDRLTVNALGWLDISVG